MTDSETEGSENVYKKTFWVKFNFFVFYIINPNYYFTNPLLSEI